MATATMESQQHFIHRQQAPIDDLIEEFRTTVLEKGVCNPLSVRAANAARAFSILTQFSIEARRMIFSGLTPPFNSTRYMYDKVCSVMREFYKGSMPTMNTLERADAVYAELRRVMAEACSLFQYVDLHTQLEATPISVQEIVWIEVRKAWALKLGEEKGGSTYLRQLKANIIDELQKLRIQPLDMEPTPKTMSKVRSNVKLFTMLHEPRDRTTALEVLVTVNNMTRQKDMKHRTVKSIGNVQQFLSWVEKFMDRERVIFGAAFRDACSFPSELATFQTAIKLQIQESMLKGNANDIVQDKEHGAVAALQARPFKEDEFRRLYQCLEFSGDCLAIMITAVAKSVAAELRTINIHSIEEIIKVRSMFSALIQKCVANPRHAIDFHIHVQNAIVSVLPKDGSFEESYAQHFDGICRLSSKQQPQAQKMIAAALQAQIILQDFELFVRFYKVLLHRRLLLRTPPNMALEKLIVQGIAGSRGRAAFHLSVMLEEFQRNKPLVCNSLAWPGQGDRYFGSSSNSASAASASPATSTSKALNLPQPVLQAFDQFLCDAQAAYRGKTVWVDPGYCTVELEFTPPSSSSSSSAGAATTAQPIAILGSVAQTAVLCKLAEFDAASPSTTTDDIVRSIGFSSFGEAEQVLGSLVQSGLVTASPVCSLDPKMTRYSINTELSPSTNKIVLPVVGAKKKGVPASGTASKK